MKKSWIAWGDLTADEKARAIETYTTIREQEEGRARYQTTPDYPAPIDPEGVESCRFQRAAGGVLEILI